MARVIARPAATTTKAKMILICDDHRAGDWLRQSYGFSSRNVVVKSLRYRGVDQER
jgi:hypothetical protein